MADVTFAQSAFPPLALGFFGLGTGYLIYAPHEMIHWPPKDESLDRSMGVWGIWLPGFCQFVTGMILFIGLTWLQVFQKSPPLYMAALAFSAYGIHWFAIGWNRHYGNDPRTGVGMSVAFMVISAMGIVVFFNADGFPGDWPVGILFCGLFLIYLSDFFASLRLRIGEFFLGLFHLLTGIWLMYLAFATAVDFSLGYHWKV